MKVQESDILFNFLKSGFSTRKLDLHLGYQSTDGWKSWEIIKKYKLKNTDKGKLYLFSKRQCNDIIKKIMKKPRAGSIDSIIREIRPSIIEKYAGAYVLAKSEKVFYDIVSGETRNIILTFFKSKKNLLGGCQYNSCNNRGELDTVHFSDRRPAIFKRCARRFRRKEKEFFKYDVYNTMKCFLEEHCNRKIICFLCKKHHNQLHRIERSGKKELNKFKKNILFKDT